MFFCMEENIYDINGLMIETLTSYSFPLIKHFIHFLKCMWIHIRKVHFSSIFFWHYNTVDGNAEYSSNFLKVPLKTYKCARSGYEWRYTGAFGVLFSYKEKEYHYRKSIELTLKKINFWSGFWYKFSEPHLQNRNVHPNNFQSPF